MTPAQWFFNLILPLLVAIVGIVASRVFVFRLQKDRRRQAASHGAKPAE